MSSLKRWSRFLVVCTVTAAAALVAATPAAAIGIDGYRFDGARGGTCRGWTSGMSRLVAWMDANPAWAPTQRTTYCDATSIHHEGRAVDWFLNVRNATQRARADDLVYTLLAPDIEGNAHSLARRMGVQEIIWNDMAWDARLGDGGMVPYFAGGASQNCFNVDPATRLYTEMHCDHVHIGVHLDGSAERSTFWNSLYTQRSDATMLVVNDGSTEIVGRPVYGRPRDNALGLPGDKPIAGDWDGDGDETPGVVRGHIWHLRDDLSTGAANRVFGYGTPSDVPVVGDWDGDGDETPGIYRNESGRGVFYLRNSNSDGLGEIRVEWGLPTDVPVAGDWDGDGRDTVGTYRPSEGRWFLKLNNTTGDHANWNYYYGLPSDRVFVGDWNGDGIDTAGALRTEGTAGRWYLKNTNGTEITSQTFLALDPAGRPIAGDWNRNGRDSVGVALRN